MRSDFRQWHNFLLLRYQKSASMCAATPLVMGCIQHSILLIVATGFAILQPRCTEAQLPEAPMPRAVLKTSRTPDKKNFSQFQFSPDGKLLATWSIASAGMFGFGSGGMGVVYKARHARLRKFVALEMIRAGELATEFEVKMFEAEEARFCDHGRPHEMD